MGRCSFCNASFHSAVACKNHERRCPKRKNVRIRSRKLVAPPSDVVENPNLEMVPISAETRLEAIRERLSPKRRHIDLNRDDTPVCDACSVHCTSPSLNFVLDTRN